MKQLEWIKELILDIEYLRKMKKLEKASHARQLRHYQAVPISAQIDSVLFRMETEHMMILELCAPVAYAQQAALSQRPSLLRAISLQDLSLIQNLLDTNPEEVHVPDAQGWTPLHLAASTESRLYVRCVLTWLMRNLLTFLEC